MRRAFLLVILAGCTALKPNDTPPLECAPPAADATDIFVAREAQGGTGTAACPYATIGQAIAAAEASSAIAVTVRIGPGEYSSEQLPLKVPAGISLVGSDEDPASTADDTVLIGGGDYQTSIPDARTARVTLVVGESTGATVLSHLGIVGAGADIGIVCEGGNASPNGSAAPPANLTLDHVAMRQFWTPSRGSAILATGGSGSGCNLRLVASRVLDAAVGIRAVGCTAAQKGGPVAVEVGDGTEGGATTFQNIGTNDNNGPGVFVDQCVSRVLVRHATFTGSAGGITLAQKAPRGSSVAHVEVTDSHFVALSNWGIAVGGDSVIDDLERNEFRGITTREIGGGDLYAGLALALDNGGVTSVSASPSVKRGRDNVFVGNDVGIMIRGTSQITSDFGRSGDAGRNTFRCNALGPHRTTGSWSWGTAVAVDVSIHPAALELAGNLWDRAPVAPVVVSSASDGDELVTNDPNLSADLSGARASDMPCDVVSK